MVRTRCFSRFQTALNTTPILSVTIGDVPMARVKMNAKHEYEFIANFKILQNIFRAKKIDKVSLALQSPRIIFEHPP